MTQDDIRLLLELVGRESLQGKGENGWHQKLESVEDDADCKLQER